MKTRNFTSQLRSNIKAAIQKQNQAGAHSCGQARYLWVCSRGHTAQAVDTRRTSRWAHGNGQQQSRAHESRTSVSHTADGSGIRGEVSRNQQPEPAVRSPSWSAGNKLNQHGCSRREAQTEAAGSLWNTKKRPWQRLESGRDVRKAAVGVKHLPRSGVTAPPEPSHLCGSLWPGGSFWCGPAHPRCPRRRPQTPARLSDLVGRRPRPSPASLCSSWRSAA